MCFGFPSCIELSLELKLNFHGMVIEIILNSEIQIFFFSNQFIF